LMRTITRKIFNAPSISSSCTERILSLTCLLFCPRLPLLHRPNQNTATL
jgi:hypothetical protein